MHQSLFALSSYVFGFWGMIVARRKGHTFFSNICILLALVGLGLIGIAAFFLQDLSSNSAVEINDKCPKCENNKGYVIGKPLIDKVSGKELSRPLGNYIGIAVLGLLALLVYFTETASPIIMLIPMLIPARSLMEYYSANKTQGVKYTCASCQNQWVRAVESTVEG